MKRQDVSHWLLFGVIAIVYTSSALAPLLPMDQTSIDFVGDRLIKQSTLIPQESWSLFLSQKPVRLATLLAKRLTSTTGADRVNVDDREEGESD